ncbi:MAG TPA: hypothetical protein VGN60_08460, partial [Devosia sp.]|nr:hypothetical protein [Devosia sp.]
MIRLSVIFWFTRDADLDLTARSIIKAGSWTPPETSVFARRGRRLVDVRLPCDGLAGITLLEDGRRGADVGARCG